jgi:hypothetical protein
LLGVVYRTISLHLIDQAGLSHGELRFPDVAIQASANWLKESRRRIRKAGR